MVDRKGDGPRVVPGSPKGSRNRAPWIILALIAIGGLAVFVSIGIAILLLRG